MDALKNITLSTIQALSPTTHARNADSLQLGLVKALLLEELREDPGLMRAARACSGYLEQAGPAELALVTGDVLDVLARRVGDGERGKLEWGDMSDDESGDGEGTTKKKNKNKNKLQDDYDDDAPLDFDELERAADYDPMEDESDEDNNDSYDDDDDEEEEMTDDYDGDLDNKSKKMKKDENDDVSGGGRVVRRGKDVFLEDTSEDDYDDSDETTGRGENEEEDDGEDDEDEKGKMQALPTSVTSHLDSLANATDELEKQLVEKIMGTSR